MKELMKEEWLELDVPTKYMGRIYPTDIMKNVIETFKKQVDKGLVFGEFSPTYREMTINLNRASHQITDVYIKGKKCYCDIRILETNMGKCMHEFIQVADRFSYRFASRGVGSLNGNSITDDYKLLTIDMYNE